MKRSFVLFILILSGLSATGQQLRQDVIASAGGSKVSGNVSLSWTLGETIIPMYKSANNVILTNGFLQVLIVTAIEEPADISIDVSIYPNPAGENVNIRLGEPAEMKIGYTLIDPGGKLIRTGVIDKGETEKQLSLRDLAAGSYSLRLIKGRMVNVYKVVKTR